MNNQTDLKIKQLQWQCRRGMLEVDLYLMAYLDHAYTNSPQDLKDQFDILLQEPDPVLLAWFTGKESPNQAAMAKLVAAIRHAPKNLIEK